MKTYRVVRKSDGALVYQYQSETPVEWSGMSFEECDHVEEPQEVSPEADTRVFGGRRRLTKLEFVALLGDAFPAILTAAKSSVQAEAWVKVVELATPDPDTYSIDLDDPRLELGLRTFEAMNVIDTGTTERVLNG
ncbi:hypothetical protein [Thauera sp.]